MVRDNQAGSLIAPTDPGVYELHYILREGAKTLARATIEVGEPEVTVTAPETAIAGGMVAVSWAGAVAVNDYITIVPVGTDEGVYGKDIIVRDKSEDDVQAPSEPGMYEVRYVLREGAKTVDSVMIEITEPEVTVSAPTEVRAGDKLRVSWTGTVCRNDYINLVPMGSDDADFGTYSTVRTKSTLDTGASLTAPDIASAGQTISVWWDVADESGDQRITIARSDQAIFTWVVAKKITGGSPMDIQVPDQPGLYEIRFLDLPNKAVLSRKVLKAE